MAQFYLRMIHRFFNTKPAVREAITRVIYGDKDQDVSLFQRPMRINALRENGYMRAAGAMARSSLLRDETVILQRIMLLLEEDMTFVDVGANIGLFASCVSDARALYPQLRVMAFEANPDTYKRLAFNAARDGFEAVNCALAAQSGQATFVEGAVSGVTTTLENASHYNLVSRQFSMPTRRLDSFDLTGPLFLKIDVEGQELAVLEGATALFDAGQVACVYIDGFSNDRGILDFLENHGMRLLDMLTLKEAGPDVFNLLALRNSAVPSTSSAGSVPAAGSATLA